MSLGDGRGSALLGELGRAQVKIRTLEDFIRERERQFHTAVSRLHGAGARRTSERRSSRFALRQRRAGITQETLVRMRTFSQDSADEDIGKFIRFKNINIVFIAFILLLQGRYNNIYI